jgi:septal ring factor EnvC (AmiA/AmiB activator)
MMLSLERLWDYNIHMKTIYGFLILLLIAAIPAFAQGLPSSDEIISKMKTQLDLQNDQVTNITPVIEKYTAAFEDLEKSIDDGRMNPSAIDSQRQEIESEETQELSPYLKAYQLSQWRDMQTQMYQQKDKDSSDDSDAGADEYSNLPKNTPAQ